MFTNFKNYYKEIPILISIEGFSSIEKYEILRAMEKWNEITELNLFQISPFPHKNKIKSNLDKANPTLGNTHVNTFWFFGDIYNFIITINSFAIYKQNIDLYYVVLHELGHALLFDHNQNSNSLMYRSAPQDSQDFFIFDKFYKNCIHDHLINLHSV